MVADRFPIPNIEEILEDLQGRKYFPTMDLYCGYLQVPMEESCKQMTTFTCKEGTFKFEVMTFGLTNAPVTFQRMMNNLLKDLRNVRVYIDAVVVLSNTLEDHMRAVEEVAKRIKSAGLKVKPKKCFFVERKVNLLGHIVDENGIHVDPTKISRVKEATRSRSKT